MVLRILLKLFHGVLRNPEKTCALIERSLGFEKVSMFLFLCGDSIINARVLRHYGARIGRNTRIQSPIHIVNAKGDYRNLVVGENCHIGCDVLIDLASKVNIGNNVTISMRSSIITHFDAGDSTITALGYPRVEGSVLIEDHVYMGCGATVLHGLRIGAKSLVGAGSLVTKEVPPGVIVVGSPARMVRRIDE